MSILFWHSTEKNINIVHFWFSINYDIFYFLQQTDIDSLLVNLRIEALYVKENFNIQWVSENGMVENIEQITEEYKQTRGLLVRWRLKCSSYVYFWYFFYFENHCVLCLSKSKVSQYKHLCLCVSQPLRICILGPPAVGKSTIAERICKHYKLHHVKLKETITETLDSLVSVIQHTAFIQKNQSMFK